MHSATYIPTLDIKSAYAAILDSLSTWTVHSLDRSAERRTCMFVGEKLMQDPCRIPAPARQSLAAILSL